MAEQMYSAEEAAQVLGLQVRTVRGYIRDGRLPGRRIGKQYRIARAELEAFTTGFGGSAGLTPAPLGERAEPEQATNPATEVSSVVQIDGIDAPAWEKLERTITAATVSAEHDARPLRVEPLYDEQRRRLKLIIVGAVAETAELLRIIDALTRDAA